MLGRVSINISARGFGDRRRQPFRAWHSAIAPCFLLATAWRKRAAFSASIGWAMVTIVLASPVSAALPAMQIHRLPDGVRFAVIGERPSQPAPTLFVLQGSLESIEGEPTYTKVVRILSGSGFIGVALDAPAHGENMRVGEPPELKGWRARVERGEDFVSSFVGHARSVLDYLIAEGYTDPEKVAACGTSRGGFLAFHFAAMEPRIKLVAGISPVTDLMALQEFEGIPASEGAGKLSLAKLALQLAGRRVWVSIGNHDLRVGTDRAIEFTRALVTNAAPPRRTDAVIPVELLVSPTAGHANIDAAHELLAAWIIRQFAENI